MDRSISTYDEASASVRERGGCLSMWLVAVMGFNLLGNCMLLANGIFDVIALGLSAANIVCAAAVWNWKRWGAYGLASSFSVSFIIGLALGDGYTIASSLLPAALLFSLVEPKWRWME